MLTKKKKHENAPLFQKYDIDHYYFFFTPVQQYHFLR